MFYVQKYIICMTFDGGMWASRPTVCIADSSEELIIGYIRIKNQAAIQNGLQIGMKSVSRF